MVCRLPRRGQRALEIELEATRTARIDCSRAQSSVVQVKNYLRGPLTQSEILHGNCDRRQELVPVLSHAHADDVLASSFAPLHVLNQLRAAALDTALVNPLGDPTLRAVSYRGMVETLNQMTHAWVSAGRVLNKGMRLPPLLLGQAPYPTS